MVAPTAPGGGYGYQQQRTSLNPHAPFNFDAQEVPYLRSAQDSDGEIYGDFPLDVSEADAIEKLFENIKDDGETPEDREPTPRNMTCILKEYQRIGLTWLLKMERGTSKGGILADEMGLGKTIQALALICANPSSNPCCKTTLIIAPVALMRQWEKEIERHIDPRHKLRVHLYHGSGKSADFARLRQFDVVLTTFGCLTSEYKQRESAKESMLREQEQRTPGFRKPRDRLGLLGHECMWYRVIIDEAHNIKNRNAKSSKACAELMAHHRLCMTGTPMNNSIDELYPLLRFLKVEPYLDWPKFSMEVGKPMKSTNPGMRTRALKRVQILLRSIMLRRQKDSTVDGKPISVLPPKHNIIDNVEFEDEEFALYKALETKSQLQMNKYIEKGAVAGK
jgi:SNF2 family DNA or RNA helicase